MANKHEMHSKALLIREMQIKFTTRCHHLSTRIAKIKKRWEIMRVNKNVKQLVSNTQLVREQTGTTNLGNDSALSIKAEHIVFVMTKLL